MESSLIRKQVQKERFCKDVHRELEENVIMKKIPETPYQQIRLTYQKIELERSFLQ